MISETDAVVIAYQSLNDVVKKLEQEKALFGDVTSEKTEENFIISDSGEKIDLTDTVDAFEPYKIYLDETQNQRVEAYRQLSSGKVQWIVSITDVETNRLWSMGFFVGVDAQTGAIDYIDTTR